MTTRLTHDGSRRARAGHAAARVAAAALLAALAGGLAALPAAADTTPPASTPASTSEPEGYAPSTPPSLDVTVLQPVCDGDVPYLRYKVVPKGTSHTTVTITWQNPAGADVVMADLPLSGRVRWPGAVVDKQGKGVDWPGWRKEGGTWVQGDEFDWVRPSVDVLFQVNPEATVTVAYPPSSPNCLTNPPGDPQPTPSSADPVANVLPRTGSDTLRVAGVAAVLLALGTAAVVLARRRRA